MQRINFLLPHPIIVEKSIGTHSRCAPICLWFYVVIFTLAKKRIELFAPIFLCGYVGISLDGGDFLNCEGVTP